MITAAIQLPAGTHGCCTLQIAANCSSSLSESYMITVIVSRRLCIVCKPSPILVCSVKDLQAWGRKRLPVQPWCMLTAAG